MIMWAEGVKYLRFVWYSATSRDRASLLVIIWLAGLTIVSMMHGNQGLSLVNRLIWLLAIVLIGWGQVGAIIDRVVQNALTEEFVSQVAAETLAFGARRVSFDFADMTHVFVSGQGWVKVTRE